MDYIIQSKIENGLNKLFLENKSTGEYCVILPDIGASLSEVQLSDGEKTYSVLDGYKTIKEVEESILFKSSFLQPFVNRIEDGKYKLNGVEYTLPINYADENNACHGFVFDKPFKVDEQLVGNESCSVKLVYSYDGHIEGYPFEFLTFVVYTLDSLGLTCKTNTVNCSSTKIPFATGWHPYFALDSEVDSLLLEIPDSKIYELNEFKIPTEKKEKYLGFKNLTKIENSNLDICLEINNENKEHGRVATRIVSEKHKVELDVWQENGKFKFNFLQIYIPPTRDKIAIEPQTSCINSFNNGIGLILLEPGEEIEAKYGVNLLKYSNNNI